MDKKFSKEEVNYGPGSEKEHCGPLTKWPKGACKHFIAPHSCEGVAGHIERDHWCKRWVSKKSALHD